MLLDPRLLGADLATKSWQRREFSGYAILVKLFGILSVFSYALSKR